MLCLDSNVQLWGSCQDTPCVFLKVILLLVILINHSKVLFFCSVELIADMYENANKAKPNNEEILSALFMAYVRLGDYKKQQQTAMALHRAKPQKNPYYFWAVMSIVMQVLICFFMYISKGILR